MKEQEIRSALSFNNNLSIFNSYDGLSAVDRRLIALDYNRYSKLFPDEYQQRGYLKMIKQINDLRSLIQLEHDNYNNELEHMDSFDVNYPEPDFNIQVSASGQTVTVDLSIMDLTELLYQLIDAAELYCRCWLQDDPNLDTDSWVF